jgi:predicted TIM-barrel fold metal-dependent hydrolase
MPLKEGIAMGAATVEMLTEEQAREEKRRLLADLGMSMDELEERAEDGLLDAHEFPVWRRVRTLNWLLQEDG